MELRWLLGMADVPMETSRDTWRHWARYLIGVPLDRPGARALPVALIRGDGRADWYFPFCGVLFPKVTCHSQKGWSVWPALVRCEIRARS